MKEWSDDMSTMGASSGSSPVPNPTYNLVSVLYHLLKGGQTYGMYIRDAQQSGDQDLVQFFQDLQSQDQQRVMRAQQLLQKQLGRGMQSTMSQGIPQSPTSQG
jgi:hypothetical protein